MNIKVKIIECTRAANYDPYDENDSSYNNAKDIAIQGCSDWVTMPEESYNQLVELVNDHNGKLNRYLPHTEYLVFRDPPRPLQVGSIEPAELLATLAKAKKARDAKEKAARLKNKQYEDEQKAKRAAAQAKRELKKLEQLKIKYESK